MFFPQQNHNKTENLTRIVYLYENGKSDQKPITFHISKKKTNLKDIVKTFKLSSSGRIYNSQGSEYFQEDLDFIKNGSVLYVSRGEDFDPASCFAEYEMLDLLGQGGFGKVYLAQHKQTNQKFAIKIIKAENIGSVSDIDSIFVQAEILKSLKHQNIVKVHKCLTMKNMEVVIIMEYLEGGDLYNYVKNLKFLDEEIAKIFMRQLTRGLLYCHKRNLSHRDLKLENLLLVNSEEKKIKIIDFGIAGAISSIKAEQLDTGSLGYMAPECFVPQKNYKFDGKVDVWAIGVILFAMLSGQLPFKGVTAWDTIESIKEGNFSINILKSKGISIECIDFLKNCLEVNPKKRISTEDLSNHCWLQQSYLGQDYKQKENESVDVAYIDVIVEKQEEVAEQLRDINNNYMVQGKDKSKARSSINSSKKGEKSLRNLKGKYSQESPVKRSLLAKSKFR